MERDKYIQHDVEQMTPTQRELLCEDVESKVANMVPLVTALKAKFSDTKASMVRIQTNDPMEDEPEFMTFTPEIVNRLEDHIQAQNEYFLAMGRPETLPTIKRAFEVKKRGQR